MVSMSSYVLYNVQCTYRCKMIKSTIFLNIEGSASRFLTLICVSNCNPPGPLINSFVFYLDFSSSWAPESSFGNSRYLIGGGSRQTPHTTPSLHILPPVWPSPISCRSSLVSPRPPSSPTPSSSGWGRGGGGRMTARRGVDIDRRVGGLPTARRGLPLKGSKLVRQEEVWRLTVWKGGRGQRSTLETYDIVNYYFDMFENDDT